MTDINATLAEMRATADLDARAGAPVGAALCRAADAIEAVLGYRVDMAGRSADYARGYVDAMADASAAIADALSGDHRG